MSSSITTSNQATTASKISQWYQQLVTKEDAFFVHKLLGFAVLLSFMVRFLQMGDDDMMFGSHPEWTFPTLLLHVALSLSSFQFRIPEKRIATDGGRIWPEFRLHSLVFLLRTLSCIAVNWYEEQQKQVYQEKEKDATTAISPDYSINLWIVLAGLVFVDLSSYSVGKYHSRSIRDLAAPAALKFLFSFKQFTGTAIILYGWRHNSFYFYFAFVLQVTAFLMTLRRKNLISHNTNIGIYSAILLLGNVVLMDATQRFPGSREIIMVLGCTAAIWRMAPWPKWMQPYCSNKYMIWISLYLVLNRVLRPVMDEEYAAVTGIQPILSKMHVTILAVVSFVLVILVGVENYNRAKATETLKGKSL